MAGPSAPLPILLGQVAEPRRPPERASEPPPQPSSWPDVLTVREAARFLQVSEQTVRLMARRSDLPARKIGKGWRLAHSALLEWLRHTGRPDDSDARALEHGPKRE